MGEVGDVGCRQDWWILFHDLSNARNCPTIHRLPLASPDLGPIRIPVASITQIASSANVSRAAASLILNQAPGHERFSPDIRARVMESAKRLGWVRDWLSNALRSGTTGVLALGLHWQGRASGLQQSLLAEVQEAAGSRGLGLLVVGGGGAAAAAAVGERRCDAALAVGWELTAADRAALGTCRHAVLGRVPEGLAGVELDVASGIVEGVAHLAGLGHRRVAWLHRRGNVDAEIRQQACVEACARRGLDLDCIALPKASRHGDGDGDADEVAALRRGVLAVGGRLDRCTGIICYNDLIALGVYAAARELGRRIGAEWSVIGFDDVHAALAQPGMTSVSAEFATQAQAALDLLSGAGPVAVRRVASRLVVRDSTGAPVEPGSAPAPVAGGAARGRRRR